MLRTELKKLDPDVALTDVRTLARQVEDAGETSRTSAAAAVGAAAVAVILALVGMYGVLMTLVEQRRREFAIRSALGASPAAIVGEVVRRGLMLTAIGIALGMVASVQAGNFVRSLLFQVAPQIPGDACCTAGDPGCVGAGVVGAGPQRIARESCRRPQVLEAVGDAKSRPAGRTVESSRTNPRHPETANHEDRVDQDESACRRRRRDRTCYGSQGRGVEHQDPEPAEEGDASLDSRVGDAKRDDTEHQGQGRNRQAGVETASSRLAIRPRCRPFSRDR